LKAFRGDASFSTWLYRLTANTCFDVLRKKSREKSESWDALVDRAGDQALGLLSAEDPPLDAPRSEESAAAHAALASLPAPYRAALTLRELQGLSYAEMAQTLGCSLDAVKARLRRARAELQEEARHLMRQPASKERPYEP